MQLTKTVLSSLLKALTRVQSPATFTASSGRLTRVCFASSVSHSEGRDPIDNARDSKVDLNYGSTKWEKNTGENYAQVAKDKAQEGVSKAADKAYETKEQAKETAYDAKEKAKGLGEKTKETVKEAWENTKNAAKTMTEAVVGPEADTDKVRVDINEDIGNENSNNVRADIGNDFDRTKKSEKDRKEDEFITFKQ